LTNISKIRGLFKNLFQRPFLRNTFSLITGTTAAQIIGIVTSPIISRIYSPADYGIFALFVAVTSILSVFIAGRYELAIMLPASHDEAFSILKLSIFITVCNSFIVAFVFLPIFNFILNPLIFHFHDITWIFLIPIMALCAGLFQELYYWSNRLKRYKNMAMIQMYQGIIGAALTIAFGFMRMGGNGLIVAALFSQIIGTILLLYQNWRSDKGMLDIKRNDSYLTLMKKYRDFPLYSLPTAFLDVFSMQIPVFMINKLFSNSSLGLYSFANKILNKPMSLIGSAAGQVFYQKFSESVENPKKAISLLIKTWVFLFMVAVLPMTTIALFGQDIFAFVFGKQWAEAGKIAMILAPMLLIIFISSPTSTAYVALRIQHLLLIFGITVVIYRPIAFLLGGKYHSLNIGLAIFAILEIIQVMIYNIITIRKLCSLKNVS
jgi:lipopolysaccharide exporter